MVTVSIRSSLLLSTIFIAMFEHRPPPLTSSITAAINTATANDFRYQHLYIRNTGQLISFASVPAATTTIATAGRRFRSQENLVIGASSHFSCLLSHLLLTPFYCLGTALASTEQICNFGQPLSHIPSLRVLSTLHFFDYAISALISDQEPVRGFNQL